MHVILPDGSQKELQDGATGADLAAAIGPGLARAALAVKVDDEVRDLARPLSDGDQVAIVTSRDGQDSLDLIRHDTAHVLAAAVLDLYPGTKISIGSPSGSGRARSRRSPLTRTARAAFASPGPMAAAASAPVAPSGSSSPLPSGRVTRMPGC